MGNKVSKEELIIEVMEVWLSIYFVVYRQRSVSPIDIVKCMKGVRNDGKGLSQIY